MLARLIANTARTQPIDADLVIDSARTIISVWASRQSPQPSPAAIDELRIEIEQVLRRLLTGGRA